MPDLYTLADIEAHFKLPPSEQHTVARNRLKALRPALERRDWLVALPQTNALAVKVEGLSLFSRLEQFMAEGLTERAAAAKVLEEIGDREAPPTVDPAAMRDMLAHLTELGEKIGALRADLAQAETRYMDLRAAIGDARALAGKATERLDEVERRVAALEVPWFRRIVHRLSLPTPQSEGTDNP